MTSRISLPCSITEHAPKRWRKCLSFMVSAPAFDLFYLLLLIFNRKNKLKNNAGMPPVWFIPKNNGEFSWEDSHRAAFSEMRGFLCDYPELRHYKIAISKHIKFIVVSDLKNHVTYSPHTGVLIMPIRVGQTDSALFAMTFIVGLIESVKKSWFRVKCDDDAAVVAQKRFLATFPEWKDIYKWAFDEEPGDTVSPPLKQIKPRMISLIRISAVFGWFFSFVATIGLMEPLGKLIDVPLPVFLLIMWTPFILLTRRFVKIISRYD